MNKFLTSNESKWRLLRTIVQGILGVIIANADTIIGSLHFSSSAKAIIVALTMAILSPIMSEIGAQAYNEDVETIEEGEVWQKYI